MSDSRDKRADGYVEDHVYAMRRDLTKEMVAWATPGGKIAACAYRRSAMKHRDQAKKLRDDTEDSQSSK